MENELSLIFIRAKIDNKWGSYSLKELYTIGTPEAYSQVLQWLTEKMHEGLGLHEGIQLTEGVLQEAINRLESLGVRIFKIKKNGQDN